MHRSRDPRGGTGSAGAALPGDRVRHPARFPGAGALPSDADRARPLVPEEDRLIGARRLSRLALRPGMTGEWQLQPAPRAPLDEMVEIDCRYAETRSALGDLSLLGRT